jgi:hypothetical protein
MCRGITYFPIELSIRSNVLFSIQMNSDANQRSGYSIKSSSPVLGLYKRDSKRSIRITKRSNSMTSHSEAIKNNYATPTIKKSTSIPLPTMSPHLGFITSRLGSITPPFKSSATADLLQSEPIITRGNVGDISPKTHISFDGSSSRNQVSQLSNRLLGGSPATPTSAPVTPQIEKRGFGFLQSVSRLFNLQ